MTYRPVSREILPNGVEVVTYYDPPRRARFIKVAGLIGLGLLVVWAFS